MSTHDRSLLLRQEFAFIFKYAPRDVMSARDLEDLCERANLVGVSYGLRSTTALCQWALLALITSEESLDDESLKGSLLTSTDPDLEIARLHALLW